MKAFAARINRGVAQPLIDLHHLAAAYVLNALDTREDRVFEDHYSGCEICTTEVAEYREVIYFLAALTVTAVPETLRNGVLLHLPAIRQDEPNPRGSRIRLARPVRRQCGSRRRSSR